MTPRTIRADEVHPSRWTERVYTCDRCGHVTKTVGGGLGDNVVCFRYVRRGFEVGRCGGKLKGRYA